jgi:Ca-activated chloride channel family protein
MHGSPCAAIVPRILLAALALALAVQAPAAAQFVSGVSAVEVYATVTDESGEPVAGLTRADFGLEEDGQPRTISVFAAGEFPLALALAVDRSFSVPKAQLSGAIAAAQRFVKDLRQSDQVMVMAVGSEVEIAAPLSTDHAAAIEALGRLDQWGTTPLFDAARQALDAIQTASGRRALVLMSDGEDRYSRSTGADLVGYARRGDVLVYPIATGKRRPDILVELAAVTGGRSFAGSDRRTLDTALSSIARELRHQYLLGYTPPPAERGGWRSIRVIVKRPGVRVRARDGYFAP